MLLQFSITNFRTFKDKVSLSLLASNYDKGTRELENIYQDPTHNLRILKSSVIYGANASGKSKFFDALLFMKHFVIGSSKDSQKGNKIDVDPFKLNIESVKMPSEFEVTFTHKNVLYRYGFEPTIKKLFRSGCFISQKQKRSNCITETIINSKPMKEISQKGKPLLKKG